MNTQSSFRSLIAEDIKSQKMNKVLASACYDTFKSQYQLNGLSNYGHTYIIFA